MRRTPTESRRWRHPCASHPARDTTPGGASTHGAPPRRVGSRRVRTACGVLIATALPWLAALAAASARATPVTVTVATPAGEPLGSSAVILEPATSPPPASGRRSSIDQLNRRFTPQLSVVQVGTSVEFPNSDNVRHHVYSFSPAKSFDLKLYAGRGAPPVTFDRPGLVVLGCNIHDSMVGFIIVTPSPHFALTAANGRATLDVPPGRYTLRVWGQALEAAPPRRALVVGAAPQSEAVTARASSQPDQVPAWED